MSGLIANGTYVLGDPNTRDLYIGNGLKQGITSDGKQYIATDETVLWEGSYESYDAVNLSESVSNFKTIKIFWAADVNTAYTSINEYDSAAEQFNVVLYKNQSSSWMYLYLASWTNNGTTINYSRTKLLNIPSDGGNITNLSKDYDEVKPVKVVGINRKSSEE